ncbi:hypothetical protein AVEN_21029-1 [Araneus ventricosus]|uniref:Uncharacterized protein n=1 Tax=Araneus ventricosus TaxID=182803 RepID=A0A4Y2D803_ARAVE|nr:hypothetical protein AVEN_21029-1 [Araneus ventricosus]
MNCEEKLAWSELQDKLMSITGRLHMWPLVLVQPLSRKFDECVYSYSELLSCMKQLLLSFEVIPVDGNVRLGMAVQVLETPGVAVFRDGFQLGRNITLDVRKPLALQG